MSLIKSERDRKLLLLLAVVVPVWSVVYFWPDKSGQAVVGAVQSVEASEKRLTKLRRMVAAAPGREEILKKVDVELAKREKGLIVAETAPQAQAQLLQIVRRVGQAQQPPVVFKGTEFSAPRPISATYGEVVMAVSTDAGIEQIINFLADVSNQPELIAVSELTLTQVTGKQKLVPARITFTGLVPRKLVPEKKGGPSF